MNVIALILVSPWMAALGAACISIPIIIHLLSRRQRPPIEWAAMQFILEAWRNQRRRLRLQNLILLIVRCLIPLVLGFALAQPILNRSSLLGTSSSINHILIDNSLVSGYEYESGTTPFESHIESALDIIDSSKDDDVFRIIPLASNGPRGESPTGDRQMIRGTLERMVPTEHPADLEEVLRDLESETRSDQGVNHNIYLLTEFRRGTVPIDKRLRNIEFDAARTTLRHANPSSVPIDIVRVVDAEPARRVTLKGGGIESLVSQCVVRLERDGSTPGSSATTITAVNQSGGQTDRTVYWDDGQREMSVDMVLPVSPDELRTSSITLSTGPFPSQKFHITVEVEESLRVIVLDRQRPDRGAGSTGRDSGAWMERAIVPIPDMPIDLRRIDPVSLSSTDLLNTDAIFLLRPDLVESTTWKDISSFLKDGGTVMVTPPGGREIHDWIESMNEAFDLDWTFQSETVVHDEGVKIDYIETTNSVLDVIAPELPSLTEPIRVNRIVEMDPGLQGTVLMKDETGIPFLISESSRGMGVLMVLATAIDLDWTSLPAKPLMVPLIQECLRGGIQKGIERRSLMLGETDWRDRVDSTSDDLTHTDGSFIAIDDPDSTIDLSGFWTHRSAVGNEKSVIAVNVNPESGDTDIHSPDSIREWMGGTGDWLIIGEDEEEESGGNELIWILLVVLALLLILESVLARMFSPPDQTESLQIGSLQSP